MHGVATANPPARGRAPQAQAVAGRQRASDIRPFPPPTDTGPVDQREHRTIRYRMRAHFVGAHAMDMFRDGRPLASPRCRSVL